MLEGLLHLHGFEGAVAKVSGLNQTPGWGTESGDQYGSGTGYDSGVGTNQSPTELDPYSAVSTKTSALNQTPGWGTESGDAWGDGMSYDSGVGTNQGDQELFPYNAVAHKATGLNQTPGWGTESGDAYGSGTGYDSGVGTNQSSTDLDPYSAVGTKATGLNQTQQGSVTTLPPTPPYVPGDSTWNISDQDIYPYNANTPHSSSTVMALAAPPATNVGELNAHTKADVCRPSPGHLIMAAHACALAAVSATLDMGGKALRGEDVSSRGGWVGKWMADSREAAAAASPVAGHVVSERILGA